MNNSSGGAVTCRARKNDLLLIGALLLAAALMWAYMRPSGGGLGAAAVVTVEDARYAVLPLDADAEFTITNSKGETNLLVIERGTARVAGSDCRNQVCVNSGSISEEGELIVCLPHKVIISIERLEGK